MVQLKVATLIHIWVDCWFWAPGESSVACIFGNPGVPCDFPMDLHPGSKGTEMIHARNFRVHPQAIMGSSIVE